MPVPRIVAMARELKVLGKILSPTAWWDVSKAFQVDLRELRLAKMIRVRGMWRTVQWRLWKISYGFAHSSPPRPIIVWFREAESRRTEICPLTNHKNAHPELWDAELHCIQFRDERVIAEFGGALSQRSEERTPSPRKKAWNVLDQKEGRLEPLNEP